MQEKVVITCALTGSGPLSKNPAQPVTPQQIAQSGLEAAAAGAAILHIHVREPSTGALSGNIDYYREVVERIRAKNTNVLLNLTTGPGSGYYPLDPLMPLEAGPGTHVWSIAERVQHVLELKPELCTLDLVTAKVFGGIVLATEPMLTKMAQLIGDAGVIPEIELFDSGDTVLANQMIRKGVLKGPGVYSFVMGLDYTMPVGAETMHYIKNQLPQGAHWQAFGIGRQQFPMAMQSVLMGGHMRLGMEDNVFISKGVFAKSNAEMVEKGVRLLEEIGTQAATCQEARTILGLPAHTAA